MCRLGSDVETGRVLRLARSSDAWRQARIRKHSSVSYHYLPGPDSSNLETAEEPRCCGRSGSTRRSTATERTHLRSAPSADNNTEEHEAKNHGNQAKAGTAEKATAAEMKLALSRLAGVC